LHLSTEERKAFLRSLLETGNTEGLVSWVGGNRGSERLLNSFLFDDDELIRRRAVEAFGALAAIKARTNLAAVRETIRRMLWAINDESGNSIWLAPEMVGEILANVPELIPEFARLIPALRDCEPYVRGVHWAMARIAEADPGAFAEFRDALVLSLEDPDPFVRGMALRTLDRSGLTSAAALLQHLQCDPAVVEYYDSRAGRFARFTVGDLAGSALRKLESQA